jgi:hypothetical protein
MYVLLPRAELQDAALVPKLKLHQQCKQWQQQQQQQNLSQPEGTYYAGYSVDAALPSDRWRC